MNQIQDDELTRFILRRLPAERMQEIQHAVDTDEEFAARVEVNRFLVEAVAGVSCDPDPHESRLVVLVDQSRQLVSRHRTMAVLALAVALFATTATASWFFLNAPLFEDTLASGWFDLGIWLPPPEEIKEGGVRAERGHVRIVNRGYLRPRREFPEPIDIQFDWKWSMLGLNPSYADHLTVALRTTGTPNMSYFGEVSDGIKIKFHASSGFINITDGADTLLARTPTSSQPIPADEWHSIRITDNHETISVYITGRLINPSDKPVLQLKHKTTTTGKRIAIYNRELVSFPHESCIRNFVVRSLHEDK